MGDASCSEGWEEDEERKEKLLVAPPFAPAEVSSCSCSCTIPSPSPPSLPSTFPLSATLLLLVSILDASALLLLVLLAAIILFMKLKDDPAVELVDLVSSIIIIIMSPRPDSTAASVAAPDDEGLDRKENPLFGASISGDVAIVAMCSRGVLSPAKMDGCAATSEGVETGCPSTRPSPSSTAFPTLVADMNPKADPARLE